MKNKEIFSILYIADSQISIGQAEGEGRCDGGDRKTMRCHPGQHVNISGIFFVFFDLYILNIYIYGYPGQHMHMLGDICLFLFFEIYKIYIDILATIRIYWGYIENYYKKRFKTNLRSNVKHNIMCGL